MYKTSQDMKHTIATILIALGMPCMAKGQKEKISFYF